MHRLLFHVEGQTEETFVNWLLAEHLYNFGYSLVAARKFGEATERSKRGGVKPWLTVRKTILNQLKKDSSSIATLMVDFYGMPATGNNAWPGRDTANALAFDQRATHIEQSILSDLQTQLPKIDVSKHFIPYIVMHEFEAFLFSDCDKLAACFSDDKVGQELRKIRQQFPTPEHINDSFSTKPSQRIIDLDSSYEKVVHGIHAAQLIGLDSIRQHCPGFHRWITRLEELPQRITF